MHIELVKGFFVIVNYIEVGFIIFCNYLLQAHKNSPHSKNNYKKTALLDS